MASLRKLLTILARPRYWRALSHGVLPTVEHAAALGGFDFATVIDVGANKGQFAAFAAAQWPDARLICFEPLTRPRARLVQVLGQQVKIYPFALGAEDGSATLHRATREDSSSLLPLGERQETLFKMKEIATEPVSLKRLDSCLTTIDLAPPTLLKIDVQGYELEVLKGSDALLPHIDAIYVECSQIELYQGQALAPEINDCLISFGFKLKGEYNEFRDGNDLAVQADYLYVRCEASET